MPFHLHGHRFFVTAMGRNANASPMTAEKVRALTTTTHQNLKSPPLKDTVSIPSNGYVTIRFITDNPGMWALHSTYGD